MVQLQIVIMGLLGCGAVYWQWHLYQNDYYSIFDGYFWEGPKRVKIPFFAGLVIFVGCTIYSVFAYLDDNNTNIATLGSAFLFSFKSLVMWATLVVKGFFAPLFIGYVLMFVVYNYFEYNNIHFIPLFRSLIEWVFSSTSQVLHWIYIIITFVFSLGSSIVEEFS